MQHTLTVRLVDITLLLLLSLMAIASIDPYAAEPPHSVAIQNQGALLQPLQVSITPEGEILAHAADGTPLVLTAATLAASAEHSIEVIADRRAPAQSLLSLHQALEAQGVPAAFLVRTDKTP